MKNLVAQLMLDEPDMWLTTLVDKYKIHAVTDGDLVSLKYNQIESPMAEPIVQQCRGMVVDTVRRKVLAWPYNKFWNHGEHLAAEIDWSTARVQEKLDGSLIQLFYDGIDWRVASSGHPTAGGSFGSEDRTFRDAFWSVFRDTQMSLPASRYEGTTFMFELCAPGNRIVVRYDEPGLALHGARDENGDEIPLSNLEAMCLLRNWNMVGEFPIASIDGCLAAAEALDPIQQEGFVVVDAAFNRVKIKSPRYVILHHMKGEATPRRAIELWQTGETGELLTHFPEMTKDITPWQWKLDHIAQRALWEHEEALCRSFDRKSYAEMAKRYPFSAVMFRMYGGDASVDSAKAIMRKMSTQALERMLGL